MCDICYQVKVQLVEGVGLICIGLGYIGENGWVDFLWQGWYYGFQ